MKNNKGTRNMVQDSAPVASPAHFRAKRLAVKGAFKLVKEFKIFDTASATYAVDTTGTVTLLNGLAEGDDYTNRNGRMARMHSIAIKGFINATATTGTPQLGRVLLVWDNAPNGALAAVTDILLASSSLSPVNTNNEERFTVLYDFLIEMDYNAVSAAIVSSRSIRSFAAHIPLSAITKYNGTAGAITTIQDGALLQVTIGSNAAGATAGTATTYCRTRFTETQ